MATEKLTFGVPSSMPAAFVVIWHDRRRRWHFRAFSTQVFSLTILITGPNLLEVFRSRQLSLGYFVSQRSGAEFSHKGYIRPGMPYYLSHLAGCAFSF